MDCRELIPMASRVLRTLPTFAVALEGKAEMVSFAKAWENEELLKCAGVLEA